MTELSLVAFTQRGAGEWPDGPGPGQAKPRDQGVVPCSTETLNISSLPGHRPVWAPDDHPLPSAVLRGERQADQVRGTHPSPPQWAPTLGEQFVPGWEGAHPRDAAGCCKMHPKSPSLLFELFVAGCQEQVGMLLPANNDKTFLGELRTSHLGDLSQLHPWQSCRSCARSSSFRELRKRDTSWHPALLAPCNLSARVGRCWSFMVGLHDLKHLFQPKFYGSVSCLPASGLSHACGMVRSCLGAARAVHPGEERAP